MPIAVGRVIILLTVEAPVLTPPPSSGLHLAARRGIAESCQLLLEHTGGHLGTILDQEGASALHHAVGSGSVDCLEYLLQAGLSPNQTNSEHRMYVSSFCGLGSIKRPFVLL